MKMTKNVFIKSLVLLIAAALLLTACATPAPAGPAAADKKPTIGLAMPTKEQPIWAAFGSRLQEGFEAEGYTTILEYAEDVVERQVSQIENMITRGAKYLIIAAVDTYAMTDVCQKAKEAGIAVISCDRLIMRTDAVDYYVTFDLVRNGGLMGEAIELDLGLKDGKGPFNLEIFSGSPDDSNSILFYEGYMNVLQPYLDNGQLVIQSGQVDFNVNAILKWDSATAQSRMDNILGAYYSDKRVDAVIAAADCLSIGVISSLDSFGYGSADLPFPSVTGQDSEITAINAILEGKQTMTVFLDPKDLFERMLFVVDALEGGKAITPDTTYNNEVKDVPSLLYDPMRIDKDNYEILFDLGFYTRDELNLQ